MSSALPNSSLGEFVRLQRGHDLTASEQQPGNVPIMGSAGPNGTHNEALAKGPGVVIGRSGASAGRVHFSAVDYWPHNTCLYVTDFLGNNPKFAYYLLQTIDLAAFNSGSAQPSLNRNFLYSIPLRVPQREEQDGIVDVLQSLDDRITLLRETNATLEAIAQALFKSWFLDFDPVRAKMEGSAPEGMDEATAALFPDSLEETELGVVPKGWGVGTLVDVATLNAQSLSMRNPPTEINYIDLTGVKANVFDVPQCYSFADAPSRARRILREGDCIVGTVRPGNRSFGFIATAQNNLTGSTGFAVLSPQQRWMAAYTYLCATQDESIGRLASLADGGAYPAVRPDVVASTPCIKPQDEVMKLFDSVARPLLDAIGANSDQAQTLSTLRDTLLPRLISGQLRVADVLTTVEKNFA